jgi:hypothetical protein
MADPTDADAHDALDELLPKHPEIERLTNELERAYRCICGFHTAMRKGQLIDRTAAAYHSPTIGAARRFVKEGTLDGADYFIGKPVEVLHRALAD